MPTVIDSLIVALKLDPKDFDAGQKKAAAAFLKTRKQAESESKKIEHAAEKMSDGIADVTRRVLELYAVFLGARGLKEFVSGLVSGDAALGRFAHNLGISPQLLSGWQMAVERMGGSASDVSGTVERLGKSLYDLRYNAKALPPEFFQLEAVARMHIPLNEGLPAFMDGLAAALKKVYASNPARAHFMAQALGIDDNTFNLMVKYGGAVDRYTKSLEKLAPTQGAIRVSQQLQDRWHALEQQATSLANTVLANLGPAIETVVAQISAWVEKNHAWLQTQIVEGLKKFAAYLKSIDWKKVAAGMQEFAQDADRLVKAIGGIVRVSEILFGLWAGSKFIAMLSGMQKLGAALGIGVGASGSGILAGLVAALAPTKLGNGALPGPNNGGAVPRHADLGWGGAASVTSNAQGISAAAKQSYDFWRSKGLSSVAALAMLGNEQGESGFNPKAVGDHGAARGIFQWHKKRRDEILAATGIDVWNPSTSRKDQLEAAYWEMTQGNDVGARKAWAALRKAKTVRQAVSGVVRYYERPLNPGAAAQTRLGYATKFAAAINSQPGAKTAASLAGASRSVHITSTTHIGTMTVHSRASDAAGIASDIKSKLTNTHRAAAANGGLF